MAQISPHSGLATNSMNSRTSGRIDQSESRTARPRSRESADSDSIGGSRKKPMSEPIRCSLERTPACRRPRWPASTRPRSRRSLRRFRADGRTAPSNHSSLIAAGPRGRNRARRSGRRRAGRPPSPPGWRTRSRRWSRRRRFRRRPTRSTRLSMKSVPGQPLRVARLEAEAPRRATVSHDLMRQRDELVPRVRNLVPGLAELGLRVEHETLQVDAQRNRRDRHHPRGVRHRHRTVVSTLSR